MGRYPNVFCLDCGKKKLYYQKELSIVDRKNPQNHIPVYWCSNCDHLIQIRRNVINDSVRTVRVIIFKNKKKQIFY